MLTAILTRASRCTCPLSLGPFLRLRYGTPLALRWPWRHVERDTASMVSIEGFECTQASPQWRRGRIRGWMLRRALHWRHVARNTGTGRITLRLAGATANTMLTLAPGRTLRRRMKVAERA
ncbi:hypothetical protein MRX96_040168 [Rhipicephalus microplus]